MTDLTNRITRSGLRARSRSTFPLGRWQVRRSGYGAMQLAGPWADNPPEDRASAISLLRAAITAGVDHIDTSVRRGCQAVPIVFWCRCERLVKWGFLLRLVPGVPRFRS